jgi:hypothetical protein
VRESDVACRFGGEEFAAILAETDRAGARAVADRIRARVETWFAAHPVGGREIRLTISGGIACFPEDGQTPETLLARADEALFRAKGEGRNRVATHYVGRRGAQRHAPRPGVVARLGPVHDPEPPLAVAVNVSRTGALLETKVAVRPPEPVRVVLDQRELAAHVVRIEPARGAVAALRVGVAFDAPVPDEWLLAQIARGEA